MANSQTVLNKPMNNLKTKTRLGSILDFVLINVEAILIIAHLVQYKLGNILDFRKTKKKVRWEPFLNYFVISHLNN